MKTCHPHPFDLHVYERSGEWDMRGRLTDAMNREYSWHIGQPDGNAFFDAVNYRVLRHLQRILLPSFSCTVNRCDCGYVKNRVTGRTMLCNNPPCRARLVEDQERCAGEASILITGLKPGRILPPMSCLFIPDTP